MKYTIEVKLARNEFTIFFYSKTEKEVIAIIDELKGVEWFTAKECNV